MADQSIAGLRAPRNTVPTTNERDSPRSLLFGSIESALTRCSRRVGQAEGRYLGREPGTFVTSPSPDNTMSDTCERTMPRSYISG